MDPLQLVRSRNRADIELPSGLGATIGLVRMQDAVSAGAIPLGVLKEMDALAQASKSNGDKPPAPAPEPGPEILAHGMWIRREMVRRTLKRLAPSVAELDGPDVEMSMQVIDELDQADFDALAGYAMRDTPFPAGSHP